MNPCRDIFLLLGSNIGNRVAKLSEARALLSSRISNIIAQSSIYQTAAWGNTNQQAFLNQAVQLRNQIFVEDMLRMLKNIEQELGRTSTEKWGPRVIDIDLLFADNEVYNSPTLSVPHPLLHKRRFTLVPLNEIAPDFVHPVFKKSIRELLGACTDHSEVIYYSS